MSSTVNAVIVDDQKTSIRILYSLLSEFFPEVNIAGEAYNVEQAIEMINRIKPDLVFLDIYLPDGVGFEVLEKSSYKKYEVIFITAHDEYALKAFDFSALDYILKPIKTQDLRDAMARYYTVRPEEIKINKLEVLRQSFNKNYEKIIIPSLEGLNIIKLDDIIRCEADDAYTIVFLSGNKRIVASRPLSHFEKILSDLNFTRIHNKHLINLKYMSKYVKGKGGYVVLEDGSEVEVSVRKKNDFLFILKEYAKSV